MEIYKKIGLVFLLIYLAACQREEVKPLPVETISQDLTPYILEYPNYPPPYLPNDNPLTKAGVALGRMLFYDPILSRTNTMSCATCHNQSLAFNDTNGFSLGVKGLPGKRQAMSVFNLAWNNNRFFWDGRAELLRHQSVMPIEDELEMDESISNVIKKLNEKESYKNQFVKAFGDKPISELTISLALEQFMNSIISFQSKYDDYLAGKTSLTPSEERGRVLFFKEYNPFIPDSSGADCAHCHTGINFASNRYSNNGLDAQFNDLGYGTVTGKSSDNGKFRTVSLRNIAITPPYMHDGRFKTLDEVLEHYNNGIVFSNTLDPALNQTIQHGLRLTEQDKKDIIAFLNTLTDYKLLANPAYAKP